MTKTRSSVSSFVLPGEYRKPAERLFPKKGFSKGHKVDIKSIALFAKALGISVEFQRLSSLDKNSGDVKEFLEHFQNNLDLLIQKTWVEKSDERRKDVLQDRITLFISSIENEDYIKAIDYFSSILEELSYLLFGHQSNKDDFTEYTFRIDAQMGLFWWYAGRLASFKELCSQNSSVDEKIYWAILLLGLCYLTNF